MTCPHTWDPKHDPDVCSWCAPIAEVPDVIDTCDACGDDLALGVDHDCPVLGTWVRIDLKEDA